MVKEHGNRVLKAQGQQDGFPTDLNQLASSTIEAIDGTSPSILAGYSYVSTSVVQVVVTLYQRDNFYIDI